MQLTSQEVVQVLYRGKPVGLRTNRPQAMARLNSSIRASAHSSSRQVKFEGDERRHLPSQRMNSLLADYRYIQLVANGASVSFERSAAFRVAKGQMGAPWRTAGSLTPACS